MDTNNNRMPEVGIPYDEINWYDIQGQPFGAASRFNIIVFGDANNIIDVEGAMAVGGNFYSPRGMSIAFRRNGNRFGAEYSPDLVRYLVGGSISMGGPLVVIGHVVAGGESHVASGSSYLIGKDDSIEQLEELEYLYQAQNGSQYWAPSDKGNHYLISSYDVSRYIPGNRISANLGAFFQDARNSIENYKLCIENLDVNGTVINNYHELILSGSDPHQNVFLIDARPNGLLNKGLRAQVPEGSLVIIRLRTGENAHLQYGVYGEQRRAKNTLYVFEDATNIYMEKSSDIWGSILASQAMFHAHPTGGHISGNVAVNRFAVNPASGFEVHLYPFVGGVSCPEVAPIMPIPEMPQEMLPETQIMPERITCPECPEPAPCPEQRPCPEPPPCPEQAPCPVCPEQQPCPEPPPCPVCPEQRPCPEPPPCPACPEPPPCPPCPPCPAEILCPECPEVEPCLITPGIIYGCIEGCECCRNHKWELRLCRIDHDNKKVLYCGCICCGDCFEFEVPYEGSYLLELCSSKFTNHSRMCKPKVTLMNVGVCEFSWCICN